MTAIKRPWGYYKVLYNREGYKVKELIVLPHKSISLQKHKERSEHWVVVRGKVNIILGGKKKTLRENQHVFIKKGIKHKIINKTDEMIRLIEVWYGENLSEEDIVRYDEY